MSKSSITEVKCPNCKYKQELLIYESINVSLDPELKEKLFSGDLIAFNCQKCKYEAHFPCNLLYHDMSEKFFIYWLQNEEDAGALLNDSESLSDDIFREMNQKIYRKRVVFSYKELIDKINIFDAGLNDKTIEFLKLVLKSTYFNNTGNYIELMFDECNEKKESDRIISFSVFDENFEFPGKNSHCQEA